MRRLCAFLAPLLLLSFVALLLPSCEGDHGCPSANLSPSITITSGAADAQAVNYKVEFSWLGSDSDGLVDRYEFAVDDTSSWEATESTRHAFILSADSLAAKSTREGAEAEGASATVIVSDFHRWHSFFVRAVDDDGARSKAERRTFNAFTVAPLTVFLSPQGRQISRVFRFRWDGLDDDASSTGKEPVGYRYKLVDDNLLDGWPPVEERLGRLREDGSVDPNEADLNHAWPDSVLFNPMVPDSIKKEWCRIRPSALDGHVQCWEPISGSWIEVAGTLDELRFVDLPLGGHAFAVRAVDEAGAVEPDYARHSEGSPGNVYVFEAIETGSDPVLMVCWTSLDCCTFPAEEDSVTWDVPADRELRFSFSARSPVGEEICGLNYGFDIPDPSSEDTVPGGIGGWIGWGMWSGNITPIVFPPSDGGVTHRLYVRVRDCAGRTTMGTIGFSVVAFTFDKQILIIDDFAHYGDHEHDQSIDRILQGRLAYADSSEITWIYGPDLDPTPVEPPPPPTLAVLARYRLVIVYHKAAMWDISALGNLTSSDNPLNLRHNPKGRALATYVAGGGKLWVWGAAVAGGLQGDNYEYPKEPYSPAGQVHADPAIFEPGSFLYSLMHFTRGVIDINRDSRSDNAMMGASVSTAALSRGYPPMLEIDRTLLPDPNRGIAQAETIRGAPLIVAGMDTLYTYNAKAPTSPFHGQPTALYYHSPDRTQGDIAYFGFDLLYFKEEQLRPMCDRVFEDLMGGR